MTKNKIKVFCDKKNVRGSANLSVPPLPHDLGPMPFCYSNSIAFTFNGLSAINLTKEGEFIMTFTFYFLKTWFVITRKK